MNLVSSIRFLLYSGHDYAYNGVGDIEPSSSSCCSPCEPEESSLELTDNYPLDDEIGRRLSQMVPTPVCLTSFASVNLFLDHPFNIYTLHPLWSFKYEIAYLLCSNLIFLSTYGYKLLSDLCFLLITLIGIYSN